MTVTKEINFLYTAQDVGHEVTGLECFRVASVGHLVVRGAVDVIEYWTGQPSLGQPPEIVKVMTVAQTHACSHFNPIVGTFTKTRVARP